MGICTDCGADVDTATCDDLFLDLLALDHSRRPPWGPLHGVVTAAFFLQHPSDPRATPAQQSFGLSLVTAYLHGGQQGLAAATRGAVQRNRRAGTLRRESSDEIESAAPQAPHGGDGMVTIHDVAVDGSFPAEGYDERVHLWAASIAAAAASGPPGAVK